MKKPSAEILQSLAKGLRTSAESVYIRAGILEERDEQQVSIESILADPVLSERQKRHQETRRHTHRERRDHPYDHEKEHLMTLVNDIRKSVTDTTPVYAVVGATDLWVEKVRDAQVYATKAGADFDVKARAEFDKLDTKARADFAKVVAELEKVRADFDVKARAEFDKVRADFDKLVADFDFKDLQAKAAKVPTQAVSFTVEAAGKAEDTYAELAARGKELVERLKAQRATQDLLAQGKVTLSRGKAAVTTVKDAAAETVTSVKDAAEDTVSSLKDAAEDTVTSVKSTVTFSNREDTVSIPKVAVKKATAAKTATKTAAKKTTTAAANATETVDEKIAD